MAIGGPRYRDREAAALRARVLRPPVDAHLLLAALKAQGRLHAFGLLADALERAARDDALSTAVGARTVGELLAASRGIGAATAHRLVEHLGLDPTVCVIDLSPESLARLCAAAREVPGGLPDGVEDWRRRGPRRPRTGPARRTPSFSRGWKRSVAHG
jgi:hypothetical protein